MAKSIKFIAAIDDRRGIAKQQKLPWKLPSDQKYFRNKLASSPGLMGWKTFITNGFRPYEKSPKTFLVTHQNVSYPGVEVVNDLPGFMKSLNHDLWVIGGGDIFRQLLPQATHLYLTRVKGDYDCDVFFPEFEDLFTLSSSSEKQIENGIEFCYQLWVPKV